jgi:hypothetical protein
MNYEILITRAGRGLGLVLVENLWREGDISMPSSTWEATIYGSYRKKRSGSLQLYPGEVSDEIPIRAGSVGIWAERKRRSLH